MTELRVRRDRISDCAVVDRGPPGPPADGEALLRVERFGLSANNVTYAALGDRLGYWRLFPAPPEWGLVPAWGYATVTASRAEGVAEGDQVFGLTPMAQHLLARPVAQRVGFVDEVPHRAELSPVYNQYLPAGEADDLALVMRPLFGTSVLLDLVLSEAGVHDRVALTSASSKTAYGLAHLLHSRGISVVGLTSAARLHWVRGLRLYDDVRAYEELSVLAPAAVLVDFTGDSSLVRRLHEHFGTALERSILVGFTHWDANRDESPPPGPEPTFFFAPAEIARRGGKLGPAYAAAWASFAPVAERSVEIERVTGAERLATLWHILAAGRADPAVAYVASV
jgi:hypothetical protein